MASEKVVNGEKPKSVTVDHLFKYPLLSQSFDFYQKQPLGAKSLDIANNIYSSFSPYFATPVSYVAPYVSKLDHMGDSTLSTIDNHFPQTKKTDFSTLQSAASWPYVYVRDTFQDECNKTVNHDGQGVIPFGKAVLSTEIRIISDGLHYVADYLGPKKDQAVDEYQKLKGIGQEKMGQAKKEAHAKKDQAKEQYANGTAS